MQQLSVTSLVRYLKNKLDTDNNLQRVLVSGEISNFHRHYSGHLYFTLKDESSSISCVMFKSAASTLSFEPKTGDKVVVNANTSIFETSGQLQLYIQKMTIDGLGDLYAKYEALKLSLSKQGYFDDDHKIMLEKEYIDRVAVLVGDKSAAMSDIKTTFLRRWPLAKVDYYPVLVQGDSAPNIIIEKLNEVDKLDYDAIILARGGGSFEDLFCFNDEKLVKCIYNLKTFVVTGIGHEQDYTLVDFVSDLRAPTPTASVELITPNLIDVLDEIDDIDSSLTSIITDKIEKLKLNYDYYVSKIVNYNNYIKLIANKVDSYKELLNSSITRKIESTGLYLKRYSTLLNAYSYENTLNRGYSLVLQNDKIIKSKKSLKNEEFEIKFIDGSIKAIKR